jgi:hypothetical protein
MTVDLDLSRLDQVVEVLGTTVPEMVTRIANTLDETLALLASHVDRGELEPAAKVAHACRNDALLVAAQPLLRILSEVEQASREGHLEQARTAHAQLATVWPQTRRALAEIAAHAN